MARRKQPIAERFMRFVEKTDGCWFWKGYTTKHGYGTFHPKAGVTRTAHSIAYEIFKGPVTEGMDVMHSCDVRNCVNPDHLSLGTRTDNMRDAKAKGRTARGEGHGRHVLTAQEVLAIRNCGGTQRLVARQFGISQSHVSDIRSGNKWAVLAGG